MAFPEIEVRGAQIWQNQTESGQKLLLFNLHGRLGGLLAYSASSGRPETGNKGYQKHDAKGHRIAGVIGPQG